MPTVISRQPTRKSPRSLIYLGTYKSYILFWELLRIFLKVAVLHFFKDLTFNNLEIKTEMRT